MSCSLCRCLVADRVERASTQGSKEIVISRVGSDYRHVAIATIRCHFGSSLRVRRASDERRWVPASITFVVGGERDIGRPGAAAREASGDDLRQRTR